MTGLILLSNNRPVIKRGEVIMKIVRILLVKAILFAFVLSVNAQSYEFKTPGKHSKAPENVAAFKILGIVSNAHAGRIESDLISLDGVKSAEITYFYKCRLVFDKPVSAETVREVLLAQQTDFFFPSLDLKDPSLANNLAEFRDIMLPDDFPEKKNSMNLQEEKAYKQAVYEWGKQNQEKYDILVELGYINE